MRDSSAEALGAIYKALGEKIFVPQVPDLEPAKLDKIKEFAEKVVLLNARGEPRAVLAAKPAAPPSQAAAAAAKPKGPTITKPTDAAAASKPASAKPGADAAKVSGYLISFFFFFVDGNNRIKIFTLLFRKTPLDRKRLLKEAAIRKKRRKRFPKSLIWR